MPNNAPLRHSSYFLLYLWWLTVVATERAQMRIGADGNGERTRHFLEIGKVDNGAQIMPVETVRAGAEKFVVGEEEEQQCPQRERSVFIEHLRPFVGRLIGKSPMEMPSVDECAKRCTQVPNCAGANFLLDLNGTFAGPNATNDDNLSRMDPPCEQFKMFSEPFGVAGEVDECMDFKLDCHAHSLTLSGFSPLKLFRGHVQPKRAAAAANCAPLRIDSAVHEFRVHLPFTRCAFEKSSSEQYTRHTNTLMVKEASTELITARDKTVQVNCYLRRKPFAVAVTPSTIATNFGGPPLLNVRFRTVHNKTDDDDEAEQHEAGAVPKAIHAPQQQQMLSTRVLLVPSSPPSAEDDDGAKRRLRGGQRQQSEGPAYRLEVLDASGFPVQQKVELGKPGFLEIRRRAFTDEHKFDGDDGSLLLSDLKAMDSENVENAVPLIDSNGCVTNASMVTSIQRMDANRIRIGIRFSGFGDKARVAYQGIVKRCEFGCLLDCNRHFYIGAHQLSDSEAVNFGIDAQNVPNSAAGGGQNPVAAQFKLSTAPDDGLGTESDDQQQHHYATDGRLPFLVDNKFGTGTPPTPLRLHRRAIPMPAEGGGERPNRHFQLRDDIWEVRTHGMEAVVNGTGRDEATVDDKENFRPLNKQMFACLRDISVLLAALQAVLLLICAYLLYVRLSFWLLNVNLATSAFLRRFIAAFARVQPPPFQHQQPSPEAISIQRPHERTEIVDNLNPNLALKQ
uniref:ZP domain-containing protein n=1 Tax=Globodera pallida TaxID=36090 RepID=A0A183C5X1_GLOPA